MGIHENDLAGGYDMQNTRKVTDDIIWVGCNDRRLSRFENIFPLQNGVSYNSYLVMDDKTILLDTCDKSVGTQFLENIDFRRCFLFYLCYNLFCNIDKRR